MNAPDKNPDVLTASSLSPQEPSTPDTQSLAETEVRGHAAYYGIQDSIASLVIQQASGRWLAVQAPSSLGWTPRQEVQFGAGVRILPAPREGES